MARTVKTADKAEEKLADTSVENSEERKFPYNVLKSQSLKLFGVTSSTFIGATCGCELENGEYSISEMKSIINKWLNRPIKKEEE
nr:MAG TPA: hypothetical protein [Caudoviricetes sp.]